MSITPTIIKQEFKQPGDLAKYSDSDIQEIIDRAQVEALLLDSTLAGGVLDLVVQYLALAILYGSELAPDTSAVNRKAAMELINNNIDKNLNVVTESGDTGAVVTVGRLPEDLLRDSVGYKSPRERTPKSWYQ